MKRIALCILLATSIVYAQESNDTLTIRVRPGDSLEVLAAEYYGDRDLAIFIMVENKMLHPRPLKPGERLRIPVSRSITTQKGDTFETLAGTYLADPRRAPFLADYNNMSPEDTLASGTPLTIPFDVQHTAQGQESLAQIAASYFRDAKQADVIKRYNFLEKTTLEKGESIAVPVFHTRVRAAKLPAIDGDAKARREQRQKVMAEVAAALPKARTAWFQGDFVGVKSSLEKYGDEIDYMDTATAVEVATLLAKAHLADGDTPYAVEKLSQVLNRKPRHRLSAYRESPKVMDAWKQAGATADNIADQ